MFALVDGNNFYASCERVFRPDLIGKPIVVLSNNDGCVIARSNEAKSLGIPMAAPAYKYDKMFKENNVTVFSANFSLYGDMSHRIMAILSEYSPEVEVYSIDEAFLKLSGFEYVDMNEYGLEIQRKVTKWTGIPISIGIAPTKALAKVANRIAKKFPERTKNVYVIDSEEKRLKALKWLKVEDIWGIGRRHSKRLKAQNVFTAYQFTQLSDAWVKKNFSIVELRLKLDLQGIPTLDIEHFQNKKSIACTRTFETNYTQLEQLKERISVFAVSCAEKLRKQKSACNSMMVFIYSNYHRKDLPQNNRNIIIKLPYASNSNIELSNFAIEALEKIFKAGFYYKRAGVVVMDLVAENQVQLKLFDNSNPKHKPLMKVIDKINNTYGPQKIRLGLHDLSRIWKMRQENLSPHYTTDIEEIMTINV